MKYPEEFVEIFKSEFEEDKDDETRNLIKKLEKGSTDKKFVESMSTFLCKKAYKASRRLEELYLSNYGKMINPDFFKEFLLLFGADPGILRWEMTRRLEWKWKGIVRKILEERGDPNFKYYDIILS